MFMVRRPPSAPRLGVVAGESATEAEFCPVWPRAPRAPLSWLVQATVVQHRARTAKIHDATPYTVRQRCSQPDRQERPQLVPAGTLYNVARCDRMPHRKPDRFLPASFTATRLSGGARNV